MLRSIRDRLRQRREVQRLCDLGVRHPVGPCSAAVAREHGFLEMGAHSYGEPTVHLWAGNDTRVLIGKYVSIAPQVEFMAGGEHVADWISTYPFRLRLGLPGAIEDGMPASKGDIRVGHDVWLGYGALILSGTSIGPGAVVGARSVVAGDVRPYAVVAGSPAREVRRRFADVEVDRLLALRWWDWPESAIREAAGLLSQGDVAALERYARDRGLS